jgi:hypothetical protein
MGPTAKRKQFSLEEKKIIISEVDKGLKKGEVAKKYGISPSTLSTILKDRESILKQLQTSVFVPSRKRMRMAQYEDVDTAVYKWFQDVRSRNVPLSGPLIRGKALEFAKMLEVENFQASVGWLNRFRERYGVVTKCISGEASDVPINSVNEWPNGEVAALINKYSPNDVFNADEAEVFFQLEPKRTLAQKGDKCAGDKTSKQRITALFCCNKSGTEKRKILIVGKSAKPRCLKNCKSLPCIYKFNNKAWMTQIIFNDWLIDFDKEMKKKNRKILLLIDNCTPHNEPPKLDNIRVEYFPHNSIAVLQPLDQGIIRAVKSLYRTFLLRQIVCDLEKNIQRKCNVKKAIEWICGAWDDISQSTITNCWKHATSTNDANSVSEEAEYDESNTHDTQQSELEQIWITAKKKTSLPDDVNLEDYLSVDDNVSTCYELTEVDIKSIKNSKDEGTDESSEDEEAVMLDDVRNVTSSEALSSLEVMRTFITSQSDVPDFIFTNIHQLQNYLLSIKTANLVQKKIVDYL